MTLLQQTWGVTHSLTQTLNRNRQGHMCVFKCMCLLPHVDWKGIRPLAVHACVCQKMADVFASDKSVWLRKRSCKDQKAESRRSGAQERGRSPNLLPKNYLPPVSLLQNTPRSHTPQTSEGWVQKQCFKKTKFTNKPMLKDCWITHLNSRNARNKAKCYRIERKCL